MLNKIKVTAARFFDLLTLVNNSRLHSGDGGSDGTTLALPNVCKLAAQTEIDLVTSFGDVASIGDVAWGPDSLDGLSIDDFVSHVELANLIASTYTVFVEEFGESETSEALRAFHRTLCLKIEAIAEKLYHATPPDSTLPDEA